MMIKPTELRIGNFVLNDEGQWFRVNADFLVNTERNKNWGSPIPLTPEILRKINGVENQYGNHYAFKDTEFCFTIDFYNDKVTVNISPGGLQDETYGIDIPCEFLHQLQNLYFALMQQELPIIPF